MKTQFEDWDSCEEEEFIEEKLVKINDHCVTMKGNMQRTIERTVRMNKSLEEIYKKLLKMSSQIDSVEKGDSYPDPISDPNPDPEPISDPYPEPDSISDPNPDPDPSSDPYPDPCPYPDPDPRIDRYSDSNPSLNPCLDPIPSPDSYPKMNLKPDSTLNLKLDHNFEGNKAMDEVVVVGEHSDDVNQSYKELSIEFARERSSVCLFDIGDEEPTEIAMVDKPDPDPPDFSIMIPFPRLGVKTVRGFSDYFTFLVSTFEREDQARSGTSVVCSLAQGRIGPMDSKYLVANSTNSSLPCFSKCRLNINITKISVWQTIVVAHFVWFRYVWSKFLLNWIMVMKEDEWKFLLIFKGIGQIPFTGDINTYGDNFRVMVKEEGPIKIEIISRLMSLLIDLVLTKLLGDDSKGYVSTPVKSTSVYVNLESAKENQSIIGLEVSHVNGKLVVMEDDEFFHRTRAACSADETIREVKNTAEFKAAFIWQVGVDDRSIKKQLIRDCCEHLSLFMDAFNDDTVWSCLIRPEWRALELPNEQQSIVDGIVSNVSKGNLVDMFCGMIDTSFLRRDWKLNWMGPFFLEANSEDYVRGSRKFDVFFWNLTLVENGRWLTKHQGFKKFMGWCKDEIDRFHGLKATSHCFLSPSAWLGDDLQKPLQLPLPPPLPPPPAEIVDGKLLNRHFHFFPP